jgi:hypothetical protein
LIKSNKRLDDLNKDVAGLQTQKQTMEQQIAYKQTNDYIEEKARDDLDLIEPGEKVYVVLDDHQKPLLESNAETDGDATVDSNGSSGTSDVLSATDIRNQNWYMWYKLFF